MNTGCCASHPWDGDVWLGWQGGIVGKDWTVWYVCWSSIIGDRGGGIWQGLASFQRQQLKQSLEEPADVLMVLYAPHCVLRMLWTFPFNIILLSWCNPKGAHWGRSGAPYTPRYTAPCKCWFADFVPGISTNILPNCSFLRGVLWHICSKNSLQLWGQWNSAKIANYWQVHLPTYSLSYLSGMVLSIFWFCKDCYVKCVLHLVIA